MKYIEAASLSDTHVFAEEPDPHGGACTAQMHSEDRLDEGVCHTCQAHVFTYALLKGLKPGEVLDKQEECVVIDSEGIRGDGGLFYFI